MLHKLNTPNPLLSDVEMNVNGNGTRAARHISDSDERTNRQSLSENANDFNDELQKEIAENVSSTQTESQDMGQGQSALKRTQSKSKRRESIKEVSFVKLKPLTAADLRHKDTYNEEDKEEAEEDDDNAEDLSSGSN